MQTWLWILPLGVSAAAAWTDARTGLIPNRLTLPALACALGLQWASGGFAALGSALLAVLLVSVPNLWFFTRGALGGGDLKLFAALAAALGPRVGLELELASLLMACGVILLRALWDGQLWALLRASSAATLHLLAPRRFALAQTPGGPRSELRLGPVIAVACACVIWGSV